MKIVNSLLKEIRFESLKVAILNSFLDSTLLFLGLFLFLSIFGMGLIIPLIISLVFICGDVWYRMRKLSLKYIEERNPSIKEMLRTAADNKDEESLMTHALITELVEKMRHVSSGTFLDFKDISVKIGSLFVLGIILVSLAFFNINIQKFQNPLSNVERYIHNRWDGLVNKDNLTADIGTADSNIYGAPSIAKLGNKELNIQLKQSLDKIDFSKVSDAESQNTELGDYPTEVSAQASGAYTGGLKDINDRKTAAEYSQEIKS